MDQAAIQLAAATEAHRHWTWATILTRMHDVYDELVPIERRHAA